MTFPFQISKTKFMKLKWYDNCNTMPHCVYLHQTVFKIFTNFSLLFTHPPTASCCPSLPLSDSFCVTWSLLMSIGSLDVSGSLAWLSVRSCSVPVPVCLPSGPCVAFWIYLLGSDSLVLLGGVVLMQCEWLFYCDLLVINFLWPGSSLQVVSWWLGL